MRVMLHADTGALSFCSSRGGLAVMGRALDAVLPAESFPWWPFRQVPSCDSSFTGEAFRERGASQ
jgi:hypothetical protein